MAQVLNGQFNTNAYGDRYLTLSWWAAQSTSGNYSVIHWTLLGAGGSTTKYYEAGNFKVVIAGETVYNSSGRINLYNGTTVATGEKTIYHNTDGTKSFTASVEAGIYYVAVNCKGSGSWELKSIPRAATITSAPDFNDTENPTVSISNPAGNNVTELAICITLAGSNDDIAYRAITKTASSYTFSLTDAERKILRAATTGSTSRKVGFYLRTTIGSYVGYSKVWKTYTVINCAPTLAPTATDTNTIATSLTGNSTGIIISGYNAINVSTGAAVTKEGILTAQRITSGGQTISAASGKLTNITSGAIEYSATDNRGQTTTATKTFTVIPYFKPTISLKRNNVSTDGAFEIELSGQFYNGSFGAATNTPKVEYRWKAGSDDWSGWASIAANISGNDYTAQTTKEGLDYRETYTIQARLTDTLGSNDANFVAYTDEYTATSIPVFDWSKTDFAFNVPISIKGQPVSDFVIEEGTDGIWNYRKWNSGLGECWGIVTITTPINQAWGGLYVGTSVMDRQSYPFPFITRPSETVSLTSTGYSAWAYAAANGDGVNGTYASAVYNVCRPTAITASATYYLGIHAVGRWK